MIAETRSDTRRGDWIDTAAGPFWPQDPLPGDIDPVIIAQALSHLCRFGGHVNSFYSVAQHSVLCAQQAPDDLKLEALLHDAADAYLGHVVAPLGRNLLTYRDWHARVDRAIGERFRLPWPRSPIVRLINERMLVTEAALIHSGTTGWWAAQHQPRPFEIVIDPWPPERARCEFLDLYRHLAPEKIPAA